MGKNKKSAEQVKEQPVTYDSYAALPDDGRRYEVIDGVLELMSPSPTAAHQSIMLGLVLALSSHCKSDFIIYAAPLDLILSETTIVQPDLMMIHRSRLRIITPRGVEGPPDLVVEILSPGSRKRDKVEKLALYEQHGVPEYWVVDPQARTLELYPLNAQGRYELRDLFEGEARVCSDKLPCVAFTVGELFEDVLHQ